MKVKKTKKVTAPTMGVKGKAVLTKPQAPMYKKGGVTKKKGKC